MINKKEAFGVVWTDDYRAIHIKDPAVAMAKFQATDLEGIRGRMAEDSELCFEVTNLLETK